MGRLAVFFTVAVAFTCLTACASVYPATMPKAIVSKSPVYPEVSITGLIVRDERMALRADSKAFGGALASYSSAYSSTVGSGMASGRNQSVVWEAYDNPILQEVLRHSIEDSRLAGRVVKDFAISIEGNVLQMHPSTGFAKISWNVLNSVSLLFMFGSPYMGSMNAEIELRLYDNGKLLATSRGNGTADWVHHGCVDDWFHSIKHEAGILAGQLAVQDAVGNLMERLRQNRTS